MERRKFKTDGICRDSSKSLTGYAAKFYKETELSKFCEMIVPGAFRETIKKDDIKALLNHDKNYVLGRNKSGTLTLAEDGIGLKVAIILPDTQDGRDLAVSIERGDINQMSFAFKVRDEEWIKRTGQKDLRKLRKVQLFDVSVVTFPAYENTDISVMRSHVGSGFSNIILPFMGISEAHSIEHYADVSGLIRR